MLNKNSVKFNYISFTNVFDTLIILLFFLNFRYQKDDQLKRDYKGLRKLVKETKERFLQERKKNMILTLAYYPDGKAVIYVFKISPIVFFQKQKKLFFFCSN